MLSKVLLGHEGSKRRQALAGAHSATNKVAQTVSKTIASAGVTDDLPARKDEEGEGTWVRDGAPKRRGNECSKRRRLLNAARASLERAQAKVSETGEGLKQKTHRGAMQASGTLARGFRRLLPQSEEGSVVRNARRLADFTACQAEVARIRHLRCAQHDAGRYNGRQRRVPNVAADCSEPTRLASCTSPMRAAGSGTGPRGRVDPLHARVDEELLDAEVQNASACGTHEGDSAIAFQSASTHAAPPSSSSLTFDLVGDEELLYAYQVALDEVEAGDRGVDDSDESGIIALAISSMPLHSDLVPFAIQRLYELVGLEAGSGALEALERDLPDAACDPEHTAAGADASVASRGGRNEEEDGGEIGEYISANILSPALARRVALNCD